MRKASKHYSSAFTLVEMMVSTMVLAILVIMVSQMMNLTTSAITLGRKRMDADSQACLIFDRLAQDLAKMHKNGNMDILPARGSGNAALYFFSQSSAFYNGITSSQNPVSLVGYRINSSYQLERLGKGLQWGASSTASSPVFLTFSTTVILDPLSTITGRWCSTVATSSGTAVPAPASGSSDPDFHVLGDQVFRFEYYYLLKDGTFSSTPVNYSNGVTPPSNVKCVYSQTTAPTSLNDSSAAQGYSTNSRWWDSVNKRGYKCDDATVGAAVWSPLGLGDVSALIVTLAVLDQTSGKIVTNSSSATIAAQFPDVQDNDLNNNNSPPILLQQTWENVIPKLVASPLAGVPMQAAAQIRVYERFFYLNNP